MYPRWLKGAMSYSKENIIWNKKQVNRGIWTKFRIWTKLQKETVL